MSQENPSPSSFSFLRLILLIFVVAVLIGIGVFLFIILSQPARNSQLADAQAAYLSGEYDLAVQLYSAVIAQDPNNRDAFIGRGLAYMERGQFVEAQGSFARALALDPDSDDTRPLYYLALAADSLENYDEAIEYLNQVLAKDGEDAIVYYQRGLAYLGMTNYNLAVEDFQRAIAINPQNADFYRALGDAHYDFDDSAAALAAYEQYIALAEEDDVSIVARVNELQNR